MGKSENRFKGVIFDLDGVLVNTVPAHFKAWKRMFSMYGKGFTFQDYKRKVDGISRLDGARAVLKDLSSGELKKAADKKQGYYLGYIKEKGVKVYKSSFKLIKGLRLKGIKIAVISASKNCVLVLKKGGLYDKVDVIVDGYDIRKGKPDPEVFLTALKRMGLKKDECVVFEDAILGVESAKRAGIFTVGIDRHRDPERLRKADVIVRDLREINYNKLNTFLAR